LQDFALDSALAQGVPTPLLRCNIVPEFNRKILPVVKKQRQNLQCGEKTTAKFALRVYPIRESPYVVFLHKA
jgi:hypothetical protein